MSNALLVAPAPQAFRPIITRLGTSLSMRKEYKNGGCAVKVIDKKSFKEQYLAKPENHGASNREITRQFNEYVKLEGERARQAAVSFFSDPDVLVNGARQNKDGSKGAVSFHRKSSIKEASDKRKATVTKDQVTESIKKFTKADLELMQSQIQELLAQ